MQNITFIAQQCAAHSIYVAIVGTHTDGHFFIEEAIARGAQVIIHSHDCDRYHPHVTYIAHPNPRRIASLFSKSLAGVLPATIIGITGTDGKSTTADFLYQLLHHQGVRCGLLTTVSMDDGTGKRASPYRQSTPESYILYPFLASCKSHGIDVVILETTSHALSTEGSRLTDIAFSGAVITPITSEHLEFHGTRLRYIDAKMNLVRQLKKGGWVVFPQDTTLRTAITEAADASVQLHEENWASQTKAVSLTSRVLQINHQGSRYTATLPYGQACYQENFLCALTAAGCITGTLPYEIPKLKPVPGRFEVVPADVPWTIIIDFAHTARAFTLLFEHVRSMTASGRIIALFGAAGERDRAKRRPMGYAAGSACDIIILTDEDPRGESGDQIADDLASGIREAHFTGTLMRIADRTAAIQTAIGMCTPGDVLLLLAKGHEGTIQYRDHTVEWNERKVVLDVIHAWRQHAI